MDRDDLDDALAANLAAGEVEMTEGPDGTATFSLTESGAAHAQQIIAEKGLLDVVHLIAHHAIEDGMNPKVRVMADEAIAKLPPELQAKAKHNFAPLWGQFANLSASDYLEQFEDKG